MKQFSELADIEKALLFYNLFKEEIPRFVVFMDTTAKAMLKEPSKVKDDWGGTQYTAAGWLELAKDMKKRIIKNGYKLSHSSKRFADQLFDGYTALYTKRCLQLYKTIVANRKMAIAIELFFED